MPFPLCWQPSTSGDEVKGYIHTNEIDCFLNMLYVAPHKEGYEAELAIISEYAGEGAVMVFDYCINLDIPELSEYGLITVVNEKGILDRIG